MKNIKFDVQGMTCSSCQAHVEKATKKVEGVTLANVNLLSNSMQVTFDENIASEEKIIQAVKSAGYGAAVHEDIKQKNKDIKHVDKTEENIKSMKKILIISICFLIPLMYLAMHHMLYEWIHLPIPEIIKNLFDGPENAISFAFTQVLLLIPIIYVNRNYFLVRL